MGWADAGKTAWLLAVVVAIAPGTIRAAARRPAPAPTPVGAAAPPQQPSASPPLSPPPPIITRVENAGMRIAITFDACATKSHGYGFDRPVFRVLQRQQVPATIFVSGRWVEFHPRAMKDLVADPLIEFGNHSYAHRRMNKLPDEKIASEIDRTEAALRLYGKRSVAFRPPFGRYTDRVLEIARDRHLPSILWDVVSGDPSASATAKSIVRAVMRKTRPGSIVIFHINGRETQTAAALPSILRRLSEQGFEFVHVSTLLASAGTAQPAPHPGADGIMPLAPLEPPGVPPLSSVPRSPDLAEQPSPPCGGQDGASCP